MFETEVAAGVCRLRRAGTRWLSTGPCGGVETADAAYNVRVPEGFDREDLAAYVDERRERAGFDGEGPALLTGVELQHARGARLAPVEVHATVGVSNPAALPLDPDPAGRDEPPAGGPGTRTGTVNLVVGTTRALGEAALANLVAVATEAKTATLLSLAGFPGTTSDAVVVGTDPAGEPARFSGSATPVGAATRACVRDAVVASFRSRYAAATVPDSVEAAEHGVVTDERAEVFHP